LHDRPGGDIYYEWWESFKRFSDEEIKVLMELKWWEWPVDKITKNLHRLTGNNIEDLKIALNS
jgi:hypothetical protein